jgi:hypothetical protein
MPQNHQRPVHALLGALYYYPHQRDLFFHYIFPHNILLISLEPSHKNASEGIPLLQGRTSSHEVQGIKWLLCLYPLHFAKITNPR